MHINYRRKNKFRGKHHGVYGWMKVYTLKPYKVDQSRRRRARERDLVQNGKFDMISSKVFRDILWRYW